MMRLTDNETKEGWLKSMMECRGDWCIKALLPDHKVFDAVGRP